MSSQLPRLIEIIKDIDQRPENRLRPKTKVNHQNTRTTKTTEQIADSTTKQLQEVGREIVNLLEDGLTLKKIRSELKVKVGSIIANGIRESYLNGFHFMEQFHKRTIQLDESHLKEIDNQIQTNTESFWNNITNMVQKNRTSKLAAAAGPFDLLLINSFNNFFANSAITMNFFALNQATVNTSKQFFKEDVPGIGQVKAEIVEPQFIWVTRKDSRVDADCLNMQGRTWGVSDKSIIRPPLHFGCRCRLLPLDGEKVFNA